MTNTEITECEEDKGASGGCKPRDNKSNKMTSALTKKLSKEFLLKEATIQTLLSNECDSLEAIATLDNDAIDTLGLSLGQKGLVKKMVASLAVELSGVKPTRSHDSVLDKQPSETLLDGKSSSELPRDPVSVDRAKAFMDALTSKDSKDAPKKSGESLNLPVSDKPNYPMQRPHQFIVGKKHYLDVSLSEFMHGSLLILENMQLSGDHKTQPYIRHLSFLALKSSQGFSTESILNYDNAVRGSVENTGVWPIDSDTHLSNCYLVRALRPKTPRGREGDRDRDREKKGPLSNRCLRYNNGDCNERKCRFDHKCLICSQNHPMSACPTTVSTQPTVSNDTNRRR